MKLFVMSLLITLMLSGMAIAIFGIVATVLWRKKDVTLGNLVWAGSKLAAHPERYVRPDRLALVRALAFTGVALFLIGAVLAVIQALAQTR
jgi:uncharacterized iron-regulated membrane protein